MKAKVESEIGETREALHATGLKMERNLIS